MGKLFTKVIQGRQFNFQPIEFGTESGYHVDVKDEEGTRWEFSMLHVGEHHISFEGKKLPGWINLSRKELEDAVHDHE